MKTQLKLLLAVTAVLGSALAVAQDNQPPSSPAATVATPPAPVATTPPQPSEQHPWGGRHGRHNNDAPEAAGQPDGQRPQPGARPEGGPSFWGHRERFQHSEGEHPDGNRGDGSGREQRPALPPAKPAPYIGVVTSSVPPILASQLGLPENFGLVVDGVLPNSPAATAGLQRFDVLKLYNDQQVVDPKQLAILVHATGKDGSASLTVIRKGQEQKISIKIGEGVLATLLGSAHREGAAQHGPGHPGFEHPRFAGGGLEHRGHEQQRLSGNGSEHSNFGLEGHRHHGFGRRGFGGNGFERHGCHHGFSRHGFGQRGFGHHGFGDHGFAENGSGHHRFGHHGFAENGFGRRHSGHHGLGHEGFAGNGFEQRGFGHHSFDRGGADQRGWPGAELPGGDHPQPMDRAGRPPGNHAPDPENRHHDSEMRPEAWHHRPSADVEPSSEPLVPDPAANGPANAVAVIPDDGGRIEIGMKDGHRTLLAADGQGGMLFDGLIDTAEQLNSVPEDIRQKVTAVEARTQPEVAKAPTSAAPAEGESAKSDLAAAGAL